MLNFAVYPNQSWKKMGGVGISASSENPEA
jgi:hypothetical protein